MKKTLVLGGPGAGKTTRLLSIAEEALASGVRPGEIAFVTFSKAAAVEAKSRAIERFGLSSDDLHWFRTLHSLCFEAIAARRTEVVDKAALNNLSRLTGEEFAADSWDADSPIVDTTGNNLLHLEQYSRTTCVGLREAWQSHGGELDWFRLERFASAYRKFKSDSGLIDFTDMLDIYCRDGTPIPVKIAIVDEAQDLTVLQWNVIAKAFAYADELYVAGDDDQSIHRWAGAAQDYLLSLDWPQIILDRSHRLPRSIFDYSQKIVNQLSQRFRKDMLPVDKPGKIDWITGMEDIDFSEGSWLVLGRTKHLLKAMASAVRDFGAVYSLHGTSSVDKRHVKAIQAYEALRAGKDIDTVEAHTVLEFMDKKPLFEMADHGRWMASDLGISGELIWHDALIGIPILTREYYLRCLRKGESLTKKPRVRIETIHGAKGLEAENVILNIALTQKTYTGMVLDPDSEHRVFYVGATRSLDRLYLMDQGALLSYQMPL